MHIHVSCGSGGAKFWIEPVVVLAEHYGLSLRELKQLQRFKKATVSEIHNVKLLHDKHLFWKDLDVDLELKSLQNLDQYPLISK